MILADNSWWAEATPFWTFMGILVVNGAAILLLLLNRGEHKKTQAAVGQVEHHVNNVEVDIDHDGEGVTLGQRLKRMESREIKAFAENDRIHALLADKIGDTAIVTFRQAYVFDDTVAAYHIALREGDIPFVLVWVNRTWEKLNGLTLAEGQSGQYVNSHHPDDSDRVMKATADAITNGTVLDLTYRKRTHLPTGEWSGYHTVHLYGEPLVAADGRILGQLGVIRIIAIVSDRHPDPSSHEGR